MQFQLPPIGLDPADSPVLERIAALKAKPAVQNATRARFVFRENEALTCVNSRR
jgi:hypothetical protein